MRLNDIECPPYAPVLMESTRSIGYSTESAIADIIDNSIAASAQNIRIRFMYTESPYIAIADDGRGMDSERITEAMRYGTSSPLEQRDKTDLGRYGLGLKTASLSQCRSLTVISMKDSIINGRMWDLDYVAETQKWSLIKLNNKEIQQILLDTDCKLENNGTVVIWRSLDRIKLGTSDPQKLLEQTMEKVKTHLELVFHRYLSGDGVKKISINMNGITLKPFDPFYISKSTKVMDDEKIEIQGRSEKVVVKPYILPHPSTMTKAELEKYGGKEGLRNLQGFYIYRNKRLLTWGTWFKLLKMDEFTKLARVQVDIPNSLDDLWTLDVKKSTAYPPEIVKVRLGQLVKTISDNSKRTYSFRERKETVKTVVHVWDKVESRDGIRYVVNTEHPILEMLNDRMEPELRIMLKEYLETIQDNLPFNNLHHDLHNDNKIICDSEDEASKRYVAIAHELFINAKAKDNIEKVMEELKNTEPFNRYISKIEEVYEDVKING